MKPGRTNISNTRFRLTDIIIILLGCGLVSILSISQWQSSQQASLAIVHTDSNKVLRLSLHENHSHHITGRLGDSTLEVLDGKIRFKDSPCKRRVCTHAGWLKESGEAAACLPNGISVVLHSDTPRYDSINF